MDVAACVSQGDSAPGNRLINSVMISSRSCANGQNEDALDREEFDESDDNFGEDALPRDRESLEHELARLDEVERRLQLETATDFVLSCELLRATLREHVAKAHAALKRRHTAAQRVCEYADKKARETYARRCAELQREMSADIDRELRRLQTAKDGVSVTSRRRRAVRDETRGGFSTPAKNSANGMRRRRTNDGDVDGPEDVFLASASPEERAHRVQFQEKKRLERLLGRASVFKPANKQVTPKEIAEDLEAIRSAVPCNVEAPVAKPAKKHKRHQSKKPKRRRPMIITPRRIPHASGPNLPASATPSRSTAAKNRRPRLHLNPRMLQEGQEVEVFKRQRTESVAGNDERSQDECVMSGIITAATATQVYVLTASSRFESFDIRDCVDGSYYVRARESPT
ncbi:hypothetical protein F441_10463 [Phytophthora nicotianae CJ01A1]|uniref:Uncharacterized protein n=2 Tax=Phytophthora nicotianae TaxID=4792 RepID=W2GPI5_PHYNI|nr:hypothetical protein L915_10283 [Phytophthora nicotianae]ETL38204.1 hypothetical protein L916_10185 [Phytophthora nicotianae]ETP14616.1 hypothetical protein F441_10463 [Phytophthora nicotianae CJ01A1]